MTRKKPSSSASTVAQAPVAVIGGGIMGALTALVAAHLGHRVRWYGPQEKARVDGADHRNYALAPHTVELLERLGVWSAVEPLCCKVSRMEVTSGPARVDLAATDVGAEYLTALVLHADLLAALEQAVQFRPQVERVLKSPDAITLKIDHAEICLGSDVHMAQIVVGADGARSWVRQQAKILWGQRDYGQVGHVAAFQTEFPHASVAAQWFTPKGILALLPLNAENQVSMVWSAPDSQVIPTQDADELARQVTELSSHRYGHMKLIGPVASVPLKMMVTESQIGLRVLLVGDAAHTVHPLAGYGLNLGVRDLLALEAVWAKHPADLGSNLVTKEYARARRFEVPKVQWGLDVLQRLVSEHHPAFARLRQMGMQAVAQFGPLRQLLIRQAIPS